MDEIRMVLFVAMFAVAGWWDFRTRRIDNRVFLIFGGIGALMYLFDWESTNSYQWLIILCSISSALMLRMFKVVGTDDAFGIMAGGIIYPVYLSIIPTMMLLFILTACLAFFITAFGNVGLNCSDMVRRGGVFRDVSDGRWRKCWAFLVVHRQRRFDKHAFLAELTVDGKRKLSLKAKSVNRPFAETSETQYVEFAMPFFTVSIAPAIVMIFSGLVSPVTPLLLG